MIRKYLKQNGFKEDDVGFYRREKIEVVQLSKDDGGGWRIMKLPWMPEKTVKTVEEMQAAIEEIEVRNAYDYK